MESWLHPSSQAREPQTQGVPDGAPPVVSDEQAAAVDEPAADSDAEQLSAAEQIAQSLSTCPRCRYGLLYPIGYDSSAAHEANQPIYHPQTLSGGSMLLRCHSCEYQESVALNPTPAPPAPPR